MASPMIEARLKDARERLALESVLPLATIADIRTEAEMILAWQVVLITEPGE